MTCLLTTWRECSDERAVLSVYPNGFQQPCRLQTSTLPVMAAAGFDSYGILKLRGISRFQLPEEQPDRPIPGAFIAGGFLFSPGSIVSDVPYDPDLYFYGEEIAMSARLWTSGFNIYAPNRLLLFHLYKTEHTDQEHAATHWGDHSNWHDYNLHALKRVHTLLGSLNNAPASIRCLNDELGELKPFGLGRKRSLHMYQQWAGIDFKTARDQPGRKTCRIQTHESRICTAFIANKKSQSPAGTLALMFRYPVDDQSVTTPSIRSSTSWYSSCSCSMFSSEVSQYPRPCTSSRVPTI